VGLPAHQMGNSEVGHMNIGAGRVVYQDYTGSSTPSRPASLPNPVLDAAIRAEGGTLHVLGLLSPGGVHSHESQIHALLEMAAREA
jgi:2,3-bisphosphoglycerate-independent phosphoglycerate mutase